MYFSCYASPPTILPSSLTSSCHLFLSLPLSLVAPKWIGFGKGIRLYIIVSNYLFGAAVGIYIYIYIYIYSFTYLLMVTCLNARKVYNFKPVAKYKMLHSRHNPTGVSKDLLNLMCGPGSSVGIATDYGLDGPGIEYRWGRDFTPVQAGPGVHPASYKVGTGSFPGVKCGRGVLLTTHPLLVPRPWKSRAIPLPTLWATPGL